MKKYDITMLYLVLDCLNVLCTFWNVIEFFFLAIMQLWLSNRIRKTVLIPFISFTGKSLIIIKKLSFITRWVPLHSFKKVLWIDTKRIVNDHRLHVFTLVYIYIWLTVTCLPWRIILMCYYLFIFFKLTAFRFNLSYPRLLSYTVGYLVYNRNFSGLSGRLGKTPRMCLHHRMLEFYTKWSRFPLNYHI